MTRPDARPGGRPRTVPAFTITRSTREMPSSTPTASPRLRRRPSTWPPHRRRITGFGVDPRHRRESRAAIRPTSARLEPATRLRSITTGSSRTPSRLACRTHTVWQYRCVPALSGPLAARTVRLHGRTAPSFDRRAATGRRRVLSPRPVSDGASRRTATSCRTYQRQIRTAASPVTPSQSCMASVKNSGGACRSWARNRTACSTPMALPLIAVNFGMMSWGAGWSGSAAR
jgi:hypothetical protein